MSYILSLKVRPIRVNFLCSALSAIGSAKFRSKSAKQILVQTVHYTKAIDTPKCFFTGGLQGKITCIFFLKILFILLI